MDLTSGVLLIAGVIGVGVAIWGLRILLTGRAVQGDQRQFRGPGDRGRYYLCFGLALALLASSGLIDKHDQAALAMVGVVVAVVLTGLAVIKYRPRESKQH